VYEDGNFWRLRWYEDIRGDDGIVRPVRRSQPVGARVGPGKISKKEAQRIADEDIIRCINEKAFAPASVMTLQQFISQRFEPEIVWSMKHSGKLHYGYCFSKIIPVMGGLPLRDVSVETIGDMIRRLRQKDGSPYSTQTISHLKNCLSAVIEHAKRVGYYSGDNPARLVRLPEMDRKKKPALSFEQAQVVLANLEEPYKTMALMSITTSLNVAELCGLRWKRVNLTDKTIMVDDDMIPPRSFAVRENYYRGTWSTVKTQSRNRVQPLPAPVYDALVELRAERLRQSRESVGGRWPVIEALGAEDPVFAAANGHPVDAHNANKRILKRAGMAAGVPSLSWHSFRRTTATLTSIMAMPKADRIALMGHSDGNMTDYYSDSDIERRRTYVDDLADRVRPRHLENVIPIRKGVA
jgi:integrase